MYSITFTDLHGQPARIPWTTDDASLAARVADTLAHDPLFDYRDVAVVPA